MNELAGFSLQPSQTPGEKSHLAAAEAVGKWEAHLSFPLFHQPSLLSSISKNPLIKTNSIAQQRPHRDQ
jgi:hypothetical protein